ncbi:hypothetical protein ACLOJK_038409 [Asimina triloba]
MQVVELEVELIADVEPSSDSLGDEVCRVIHLDVDPLKIPSMRSNTTVWQEELMEEKGASMVEGAAESSNIIAKGGVSADEVVERATEPTFGDYTNPQGTTAKEVVEETTFEGVTGVDAEIAASMGVDSNLELARDVCNDAEEIISGAKEVDDEDSSESTKEFYPSMVFASCEGTSQPLNPRVSPTGGVGQFEDCGGTLERLAGGTTPGYVYGLLIRVVRVGPPRVPEMDRKLREEMEACQATKVQVVALRRELERAREDATSHWKAEDSLPSCQVDLESSKYEAQLKKEDLRDKKHHQKLKNKAFARYTYSLEC